MNVADDDPLSGVVLSDADVAELERQWKAKREAKKPPGPANRAPAVGPGGRR